MLSDDYHSDSEYSFSKVKREGKSSSRSYKEAKSKPKGKNGTKVLADMSVFQNMEFDNVKDIREKINKILLPQNVKMICKRSERVYSNSYCVFVLYCNK